MTPSTAWHVARPLLTAVITALLAWVFLLGVAEAQPTRALVLPSTLETLIAQLLVPAGLGSIVVVGVVAVARLLPLLRGLLAPTPSTDRSVLGCRLLALAVGLAWCSPGLGPLAQLLTPEAAGPAVWMVRGLDGFVVAAVAMVGRDVLTDTGRVGKGLFGGEGGA